VGFPKLVAQRRKIAAHGVSRGSGSVVKSPERAKDTPQNEGVKLDNSGKFCILYFKDIK
jgi:hypothetical protein